MESQVSVTRVPRKTAKGIDEITRRTRTLGPKMRQLLVMVNGVTTEDELKLVSHTLGFADKVIQDLHDEGFIEFIDQSIDEINELISARPVPPPAIQDHNFEDDDDDGEEILLQPEAPRAPKLERELVKAKTRRFPTTADEPDEVESPVTLVGGTLEQLKALLLQHMRTKLGTRVGVVLPMVELCQSAADFKQLVGGCQQILMQLVSPQAATDMVRRFERYWT